MRHKFQIAAFCAALATSPAVQAQQPWPLTDNLQYLALGDSLTAGKGATPVTNGYVYHLYQQGVYASMTNTTFANAAVPGATSQDVLYFQVPAAKIFPPQVITMTVGGNDLLAILDGTTTPGAALQNFQGNLIKILAQLCTLTGTRIYVGNLYAIRDFPVPTDEIVGAFNQVLAGVVSYANSALCDGRVRIADLHAAFSGSQQGLLLINRNGAGQFEVHPTNAGYRAIAEAFIAAK